MFAIIFLIVCVLFIVFVVSSTSLAKPLNKPPAIPMPVIPVSFINSRRLFRILMAIKSIEKLDLISETIKEKCVQSYV